MTLRKRTHQGLHAAVDLALAEGQAPVSAAEVAGRRGLTPSAAAKLFQHLVRAGIAVGVRGTRGGYCLARDARSVTMLEVIEAFQPLRPRAACGASPDAALHAVFDEVEDLARATYASITLETLARKVGVTGPAQRGLSAIPS